MFRLRIILISLCGFAFIACKNDNFTLGQDWINPSTQVIFTDTCTVSLSTMWYDSIVTSAKDVALIGLYNDAYIGKINASSYFEVSLPSVSLSDVEDGVFDSMYINLYCNGSYFGDTAVYQTVNIHQLTKAIVLDEGYLYNSSKSEYNPTPIISKTFRLEPSHTDDELKVRLPDNFGKELLTKFVKQQPEIENNDKFVDYFKGLVFIPDSEGAVYTYKVNDTIPFMTLYYHVNASGRQVDKEIHFYTNKSKQFYQITADRSQTSLKNISAANRIISSKQDGKNQSYVASGVPLCTKLDFPGIRNFSPIGKYGKIISAELRVRPFRAGYVKNAPLPQTLNIAMVNEANELGSLLTDRQNNLLTGNLRVDHLNYKKTYYTFDITSYLNNKLNSTYNDNSSLAIVIPSSELATTVKRLVIGDSKSAYEDDRIQLEIQYSSYIGEN